MTIVILGLPPLQALGDRVLPAQADDIARVDAALGSQSNPQKSLVHKKATAKTDNFGASVSDEAKTLKDADAATRQAFGQSIADQRRQSNGIHGQANGHAIVTWGASDPRSQVPANGNGAGNHPKSPGKP